MTRRRLYGICTRRPRSCTRAARRRTHDDVMDAVAILLAVAVFAALLALVEGLDRV
jgi:hypothetical protein